MSTKTLKNDLVKFRVTEQDKDQLKQNASKLGLNVSAYARMILLADIRKEKTNEPTS